MAKFILWFAVVALILAGIVTDGDALSLFSKGVLWFAVGILAICESIDKLGRKD